jgi:hypothetical protein
VHVDCLCRWYHQRKYVTGSKRGNVCDVCKVDLSYPGMPTTRSQVPTVVRRIWAGQLAASAFRLLQHYIVSITLMGGLETAVSSIMASFVAYRSDRRLPPGGRHGDDDNAGLSSGHHASNLIKAITGVSIIRTVVMGHVDLFSHVEMVRRWCKRMWDFVGLLISKHLRI